MAHVFSRASRAVRIPPPSRNDEAKVGASIEAILDSRPESAAHPRMLDAAIGIRNGVIGGAVFWAAVAAVYFWLG
jgi:hypothetical protein